MKPRSDPDVDAGGVESVREVAERLQKLIQGVEVLHKAHSFILLVAHTVGLLGT